MCARAVLTLSILMPVFGLTAHKEASITGSLVLESDAQEMHQGEAPSLTYCGGGGVASDDVIVEFANTLWPDGLPYTLAIRASAIDSGGTMNLVAWGGGGGSCELRLLAGGQVQYGAIWNDADGVHHPWRKIGFMQSASLGDWTYLSEAHDYVVVHDIGGKGAIYVDGELVVEKDDFHDASPGASMGSWAYSAYKDNSKKFNGQLGALHIYKGAIGPDLVKGLDLSTCPAVGSIVSSAKGDPHLVNQKGESFDVMQEGNMLLLNFPRGSTDENSDITMHADIERFGVISCGPTYITNLYMTGKWLGAPVDISSGKIVKEGSERPGAHRLHTAHVFGINIDHQFQSHADFEAAHKEGLQLSEETMIEPKDREFFLTINCLKVAVHQPVRPRIFLDLYISGINDLNAEVGGLLGIDDYKWAAKLPDECVTAPAAPYPTTHN